ncbi:MAG: B12-binding domain-containing protein, partial [Clostridiales bacterium]|nr:B12-binding domain-containing protein [Candidatus Apopatocola equi]
MDQELLEEIRRLIIGGKVKRISNAVQLALISGFEPQTIIDTMTDAMLQVGELFHNSDIYVPEMLVASAAMKKGLTLLRPLPSAERQTNRVK